MADLIGVVISIEDDSYNGKDFKKVTLGTGEVLKVKQGREGALKAKWGLLQEGVAVRFIMTDFTKPDGVKIPFVSDIETVEGALPSPVAPKQPTGYEGEVTIKPAPQAVGMITKEIGDMIRAKYLVTIFGNEIAKELIKWYRSQTLWITGIPFDEAKLPNYEVKKGESSG